MALCFSRDHPQLLAIGFYDSTILVINISSASNLIGLSQRKPSLHNEPISQIKWIKCMLSRIRTSRAIPCAVRITNVVELGAHMICAVFVGHKHIMSLHSSNIWNYYC